MLLAPVSDWKLWGCVLVWMGRNRDFWKCMSICWFVPIHVISWVVTSQIWKKMKASVLTTSGSLNMDNELQAVLILLSMLAERAVKLCIFWCCHCRCAHKASFYWRDSHVERRYQPYRMLWWRQARENQCLVRHLYQNLWFWRNGEITFEYPDQPGSTSVKDYLMSWGRNIHVLVLERWRQSIWINGFVFMHQSVCIFSISLTC